MLNVRLAGDHLYGKLLFTWLSLVMSMMVSFCAVLFPTRCLGWDLELNWVSFWGFSFLLSQREGERGERTDESKNIQTTPSRTYCKRNRPLSYCNQNCRTPRQWKFTQHHRTTRPPSYMGVNLETYCGFYPILTYFLSQLISACNKNYCFPRS